MSIYLRYFLNFWALLLTQVTLLNRITLQWWSRPSGFPVFQPQVYPLFILLLPIQTPIVLLLSLGFITGLTMDMYCNTGAFHAFATVLLAFSRTYVLQALLPKSLREYRNEVPDVSTLGWLPFLTYGAVLLLLHHIAYFTLEMWSAINLGYLLIKIIVSLLTSLLLCGIYMLLFSSSRKRAL